MSVKEFFLNKIAPDKSTISTYLKVLISTPEILKTELVGLGETMISLFLIVSFIVVET